ncbi:MAG: DUF4956 domain-containing protein [Bacteroidales bacterium]|nr:DUF4956 domain-containing protein [Bacteroidales bacterium]
MEITQYFTHDYLNMLVRLLICLAINFVLVDRLYYPKSKRRDFYFTFILINIAIFLLVFFMIFVLEDMKAKTSMGIGIGLFGIFSIMRYRTDTMPVREMTYLFLIVALSVVNAVSISIPLFELVFTDLLVVAVTWVCELRLRVKPSKLIQYDRINLITPEHRDELIDDLRRRTGLNVSSVEVGAIDFLRDSAMLRVYYTPSGTEAPDTVDSKLKFSREDLSSTL